MNKLQKPQKQRFYLELLFLVGPRGGHVVTQRRLQRVRLFSRRIRYLSNVTSTFNPSVYKLLLSGDIENNPGYESAENSSHSSSTQGLTRNYKYPCKLCGKPVRCNQKGILCDSCESLFQCRCIGM